MPPVLTPRHRAPDGLRALAAAFGCLALAACGGGGSSAPAPALSVGATTLSMTGTLGAAAPTGRIAVSNTGGGSLSFQVSADAAWLAVSPASGSVAAGASANVTATGACSQPGSRTATVTVTGAGRSAAVSVELRCDAPPIAIAASTPADAEGEPRQAAAATTRWSISSSWSGQGPVDYSIAADSDTVTVQPRTGTVALDTEVETALEARCADQGTLAVAVTITAGDASESVSWSVRCRAGNATHARLTLYQGPQAWTRNWAEAEAESFVTRLAGRRVAVVARASHESPTVPELRARIVDASGAVLNDGLAPLFDPATGEPLEGETEYTTVYGFDLPGSLYRNGNQAVLELDPDAKIDETDEDDNVRRLRFDAWTPPTFQVAFIPIHSSVGEPGAIDPEAYMRGIFDLLPIADDYRATTGEVFEYEGEEWNLRDAALDLLHRWTAEADADEFHHGIFKYPYDGSSCGYAWYGAPVAISAQLNDGCKADVHIHELGHNLQLGHADGGCGANNPDPDYPYENAGIGPRPGWLFSEARFVNPTDGYYDTMSYCEPNFISDYHYEKAVDYWRRVAARESQAPVDAAAADRPRRNDQPDARPPPRSIAVTGGIDAFGVFAPARAGSSAKPPRQPPRTGAFALTLLDESGAVRHREPLAIHPGSDADGAAWSARVPAPDSPGWRLVVRDGAGNAVLDQRLDDPIKR